MHSVQGSGNNAYRLLYRILATTDISVTINRLLFVTYMRCVFSEVRTDFKYISIQVSHCNELHGKISLEKLIVSQQVEELRIFYKAHVC